jgi:hypothetical protein
MIRLTGSRGRFGAPDCPPAENRPRFRPNGAGPAAESVLREMAFVLHLTRSVRTAMMGQEIAKATRPD